MVFKRILVPLDGSALSERAIPHAVEFARLLNGQIILLHVLENDPLAPPPDPLSWQIRRADAELHLREVEGRVLRCLDVPVEVPAGTGTGTALPVPPPPVDEEAPPRVRRLVAEGKTAETIVDVGVREGVDLLVMGTHGAGGLSRWNLNSVVQKVINLAYVPVLLVRSYKPSDGEDAPVRYARILVPLDGSRRAECALPAAVALAQMSGAHIVLTSIIRPPELPASEPMVGELKDLCERLSAAITRAYRIYLQEVAERLPVFAESILVEQASVTHAIQDLAVEVGADLVVLCAHGQASQGDQPYGTVARYSIHDGTMPLLIVQDIQRSESVPTEAERIAESTRSR